MFKNIDLQRVSNLVFNFLFFENKTFSGSSSVIRLVVSNSFQSHRL